MYRFLMIQDVSVVKLYVSLISVMVYNDMQVCFYNVQVTMCHSSSSFHRNNKFLLFSLDFGAVWQNKVYIIYVAMMICSLLIEHCLEAEVERRHLLFSSCCRGAQVRLHSLSWAILIKYMLVLVYILAAVVCYAYILGGP